MATPNIRAAYQRKRSPFLTVGESATKQSFAKECDVNHILKKYEKTGLIDHVNRFQGDYSDLTDSVDFHTAMNIVIDAENAFASLPSTVRNRFGNDPGQFLDFVSDPENQAELIELGLANPVPTVEATPPASGPEPPAGDPEPTATEGA